MCYSSMGSQRSCVALLHTILVIVDIKFFEICSLKKRKSLKRTYQNWFLNMAPWCSCNMARGFTRTVRLHTNGRSGQQKAGSKTYPGQDSKEFYPQSGRQKSFRCAWSCTVPISFYCSSNCKHANDECMADFLMSLCLCLCRIYISITSH